MGSPNTVTICANCRTPIIQWNNTGAWEHLNAATADQAKSRAYHTGGSSSNLSNATICNSPRLAVEQQSKSGKTVANYRTATP
jgi:hypothetical protein